MGKNHFEIVKNVRFYPTAKHLNYNNAYVMAVFSLLSYEDDKTAIDLANSLGWNAEFIDIEETDTQAFVLGNDSAIITAFRGTTNLADGVTDLTTSKVHHPFGEAHEGFSVAFHSAKFKLVEAIRRRRTNQPVWVTGHSLGAALATLATAYLPSQKMKPRFLYTFGSPRVGDPDFSAKFMKIFQNRVFRFRNNQDVVTNVPIPPFFEHVGEPIYFDDDGSVNRGMTGLEMSLDSFSDTLTDKLNPMKIAGAENLDDHRMGHYADNLSRLIKTV